MQRAYKKIAGAYKKMLNVSSGIVSCLISAAAVIFPTIVNIGKAFVLLFGASASNEQSAKE